MAYSIERLMALVPHSPSKIHTFGVLQTDYFNGQGERLNTWHVQVVAEHFHKYFDGRCNAHSLAAVIRYNLGPKAVFCFWARWKQARRKYSSDIYEHDFAVVVSAATPYQRSIPGRYSGGFGS